MTLQQFIFKCAEENIELSFRPHYNNDIIGVIMLFDERFKFTKFACELYKEEIIKSEKLFERLYNKALRDVKESLQ